MNGEREPSFPEGLGTAPGPSFPRCSFNFSECGSWGSLRNSSVLMAVAMFLGQAGGLANPLCHLPPPLLSFTPNPSQPGVQISPALGAEKPEPSAIQKTSSCLHAKLLSSPFSVEETDCCRAPALVRGPQGLWNKRGSGASSSLSQLTDNFEVGHAASLGSAFAT